ncbi:hypothetical protein A0H81_05093 [Grifola frondosa]|uniref:Hydrophobin n=1 Tax=Grifola frondosa TaxID=5627 RepID=A0A1C7MCE8_GRIFR|nr:hypothetical protein A0H81_05093 [Grifola frondosa]
MHPLICAKRLNRAGFRCEKTQSSDMFNYLLVTFISTRNGPPYHALRAICSTETTCNSWEALVGLTLGDIIMYHFTATLSVRSVTHTGSIFMEPDTVNRVKRYDALANTSNLNCSGVQGNRSRETQLWTLLPTNVLRVTSIAMPMDTAVLLELLAIETLMWKHKVFFAIMKFTLTSVFGLVTLVSQVSAVCPGFNFGIIDSGSVGSGIEAYNVVDDSCNTVASALTSNPCDNPLFSCSPPPITITALHLDGLNYACRGDPNSGSCNGAAVQVCCRNDGN